MSTRIPKRILVGIISFTLFAIAVVTIAIISTVQRNNSGTLDLLVAPTESNIIINGKHYHNGTHYLLPGTYTVDISMDGFTSKTFDISISVGTTTSLHTYLVQDDGSMSWYDSHPEDLSILTTIGDTEAIKKSQEYADKYPVIDAMPIIYAQYSDNYQTYTEFRIDGGSFSGCKKDFCLKITDTTGGNMDNALRMIREAGYNPDDYEILYEYLPIVPLN